MGVPSWERVVEAGRVVTGPRGGQLVGAVSALRAVRLAEGARGLRIGPRARGSECGLGADKESTCGGLLFHNLSRVGPRSLAEAGWMVCAQVVSRHLG